MYTYKENPVRLMYFLTALSFVILLYIEILMRWAGGGVVCFLSISVCLLVCLCVCLSRHKMLMLMCMCVCALVRE